LEEIHSALFDQNSSSKLKRDDLTYFENLYPDLIS